MSGVLRFAIASLQGDLQSAFPAYPGILQVADRIAEVSFEDRFLRTHIGHIVRINSRTATVEAQGASWRVSFTLLRPVIDAR